MIYSEKDITKPIFNKIKKISKELWRERYSDDYGYVTEKLERINNLGYHPDNIIFLIGQFDSTNQVILYTMLLDNGVDPKPFEDLFYFIENKQC